MLNLTTNQIATLIRDAAAATDINDHNGALLLVAKAVKHERFVKIIGGIMQIHDALDSMPYELLKLRDQIVKQLKDYCKANLTADAYKQLIDNGVI